MKATSMLCIVAVTLLLCSPASAEPVTISGKVLEYSGAVIPDMPVYYGYGWLDGDWTTGQTVTDDTGNYEITVPSGCIVTWHPNDIDYDWDPSSYTEINIQTDLTNKNFKEECGLGAAGAFPMTLLAMGLYAIRRRGT